MRLELQKPYKLRDVVQEAFNFFSKNLNLTNADDEYDIGNLFTTCEDYNNYSVDTIVYLDEPVDDNEYDEENNPEGYSRFVLDNDLDLFCYGYIFSDVMSLYCEQKKDLDMELFFKCLKYYQEHDTFLDID